MGADKVLEVRMPVQASALPEERLMGKPSVQQGFPFPLLILALLVALFVSVTLAITIGPVDIPFFTVWKIALDKVLHITLGEWTKPQEQIVWLVRFPRVLLAIFVGGGLAIVGATMQAVVRNNMAGPYVLGISSGASAGAAIAILSGSLLPFSLYTIPIAAFLGSLCAFALVFVLARSGGRLSSRRLVLSGIAISYLFSAVTSLLTYLAPDEGLRRVTFWMMGSLSGAHWADLTLPAIALLVGMLYLLLQARDLNSLVMGEETAMTLGVDTNGLRKRLFVVTSFLTAMVVVVSGSIGFVGLMMPHIVRLLVGPDHRRLLPVCMLTGSIFLIWMDVAARMVLAPQEVPIGVLTSIVGSPFFIWLMNRKKGRDIVLG